jgi:hypothetical protein
MLSNMQKEAVKATEDTIDRSYKKARIRLGL